VTTTVLTAICIPDLFTVSRVGDFGKSDVSDTRRLEEPIELGYLVPTIHRAHGLRFVIFTDDHRPAHVHPIGGGGEAMIDFGAADGPPRLVWAKGLSTADIIRAMTEVAGEQRRLRAAWSRIYGENDR
jgi:Domain of unknown function (DUF4160)